jgi:hypothetical protein
MANWLRVIGSLFILFVGTPCVTATQDVSGTYFVAIGHSPRFTMELSQSGNDVTFSLDGAGILITGWGTISGRRMTLAADLGEMGLFAAETRFRADGESFSGTWEISDGNPVQGTITGTTAPWATYDVVSLGLPRFGRADCIELHKIARVSRFRSGSGHDYSDDFESCRSMKHYYDPRAGVDRLSLALFSPVDGTVLGTTNEWDGPDVWKGEAVGIRVDGHPAFDVVIFHVNLDRDLVPGDRVTAGERLGTSQKQSGTVTDMAVGVHTPSGYMLVSYFEIIQDRVFERYRRVGARKRSQFIISREDRDADPLECDGEEFVNGGNLENWVTLRGLPAPRSGGRSRTTP